METTRRPSLLERSLRIGAAQLVGVLLTTLEHVQSMGRNLSSRLLGADSPTYVRGCPHCGLIVETFEYYRSDHIVGDTPYCPTCGKRTLKMLGALPLFAEAGGKVYLTDSHGEETGPFNSVNEARDHLWEWFRIGAENAKKEGTEGGAGDTGIFYSGRPQEGDEG